MFTQRPSGTSADLVRFMRTAELGQSPLPLSTGPTGSEGSGQNRSSSINTNDDDTANKAQLDVDAATIVIDDDDDNDPEVVIGLYTRPVFHFPNKCDIRCSSNQPAD